MKRPKTPEPPLQLPSRTQLTNALVNTAVTIVANWLEDAGGWSAVLISKDGNAMLYNEPPDQVIARLRSALQRYGHHQADCALKNGGRCSCGYSDLV